MASFPKAPRVADLRWFTGAVYGGTGRGRLSAVALTVAVLGAATACQQEDDPGRARESVAPSSDDGASPDVETVDYEHWKPVYGEVRPAMAGDVESLRRRVLDLNGSAYTAMVPLMGLEIASTPDHVRVRFGEGAPGGFDLHLDPTASAKALLRPFVICSADEGSCVEVGEEAPKGGGPHMFNNGMDSIIFFATGIVDTQRTLPDTLLEADEDASMTTVDSPSGNLDCLLTGSTPEQRAQLDGKPVDQAADPVMRHGDPEPLSTLCVDERGLVVVSLPSLMMGVVPYGSFEPSVPDGFDEHPDPVPYGTSPPPSPTQSPTAAPMSPGTDPDKMYDVLLAAAPIPAGESVADAQMSGSFELDVVPGDEVVPGAVAATEGLDGVALEDIAEGEQITEDSFG